MNAIDNGRRDIRSEEDFVGLKTRNNEIARINNTNNKRSTLDKNDVNNVPVDKFAENIESINGHGLLKASLVNDIAKEANGKKWFIHGQL